MDLSTLITILAGFAGILGFLYLLFVGQKSLFEWWKERKLLKNRESLPDISETAELSLNAGYEQRKITSVSWDSLITAVDKFVSESTKDYDLIVGIAKGGLPIAVSLAHRLKEARFSAMLKRYVDVKQAPFFVFEKESHKRSERQKVVDMFSLPVHDLEVRRVLVVDDVTTFGNSLETAELLIKEQLPNAEVDFFVYAVDMARLAASKPKLSERVYYHVSIDNRQEWLQFPWEK